MKKEYHHADRQALLVQRFMTVCPHGRQEFGNLSDTVMGLATRHPSAYTRPPRPFLDMRWYTQQCFDHLGNYWRHSEHDQRARLLHGRRKSPTYAIK